MITLRSYLFTSQDLSAANLNTTSKRRRKIPQKDDDMSPSRGTTTRVTPATPPPTSTNPSPKPTIPTSPVVIPARGYRDSFPESHRSKIRNEYQHGGRRRNIHSADATSPSVAALLAITQIPNPRLHTAGRTRARPEQRLTVDAVLQHTGVSEKEFSMSLGKSQLDLLLSPPEELEDEIAGSDNGQESVTTMSSESVPSLDDDSTSETSLSLNSLLTPSSRGRRSLPSRRVPPYTSPPSSITMEDHPLSDPDIDIDQLDFRVFQNSQGGGEATPTVEVPTPPRKSAFKSNLTASLRALRSAAMSLSSLTAPMITPDDFLTRSIISIDPQVPFTDERMPPRLEDTPTPALRRYLNPTTNAPIEAHMTPSRSQALSETKCTASIQMETYKISRSSSGILPSVISRRTKSTEEVLVEAAGPVGRQREMRENSDFIRIAVMEMAMRKKGKLDDQKPGRAKWALPPRKVPTNNYEIGADGVPIRWIPQVQ
ncbi:Uncharacterized protein BP5553_03852 [Venustampulla echinocandica]|uniref:Uncharacterized protein n=1 Tax=Venustampulla echinocandica TaxID=2656787 RepID=A0A370TVE2_9HELO|nr:Uncharacterized protein BP5553_03852 [Venustampulla echinocandica]RDL39512.1 Uncharacterized protein BP5553_03852 [Venustampulla echinocandica]